MELDRPRAVCTNRDCGEEPTDLEEASALYKSVCHDGCAAISGDLRWCSFMKAKSLGRKYECKACGHDRHDHKHITYDLRERTVIEGGEEVALRLKNSNDNIEPVRELVEKKKHRVEQFKNEQKLILEACSQFTFFMTRNSITPYNDTTIAFLEEQIDEEKRKLGTGSGKPERLRRLEESLHQHEKMVGDLKSSLERGEGQEILEENGIEKRLKTLYELPIFGRDLQKIKEAVDRTRQATFREKPHPIRVGAHWPSGSSGRWPEFKRPASSSSTSRVKSKARRMIKGATSTVKSLRSTAATPAGGDGNPTGKATNPPTVDVPHNRKTSIFQ